MDAEMIKSIVTELNFIGWAILWSSIIRAIFNN